MPSKLRSNFKVRASINTTLTQSQLDSLPPDSEIVQQNGWLKTIVEQTVSVDLGSEVLSSPHVQHRTGKIILWLEDDDDGKLMTAIRSLQQGQLLFSLDVDLFSNRQVNAERVIETFSLDHCLLDALQHSMLSYEPVTEAVELTGVAGDSRLHTSLRLFGTISSSANRAHSMKLLQISFINMTHQIFW